jgi:hypothetical protein
MPNRFAGPYDDQDAEPEERDNLTDRQKAIRILREFGWNDEGVAMLMSWGNDAAARILETPAVFATPPPQFLVPQSSYAEALTKYGFEADTRPMGPDLWRKYGGVVPGSWSPSDYRTNETGAVRFNNGVIADPDTQTVIYPPNDPAVVGSPAWLRKVQDEWSEDKVNAWRHRLREYGYDVAKRGPLRSGPARHARGVSQGQIFKLWTAPAPRWPPARGLLTMSSCRTCQRLTTLFDRSISECSETSPLRMSYETGRSSSARRTDGCSGADARR